MQNEKLFDWRKSRITETTLQNHSLIDSKIDKLLWTINMFYLKSWLQSVLILNNISFSSSLYLLSHSISYMYVSDCWGFSLHLNGLLIIFNNIAFWKFILMNTVVEPFRIWNTEVQVFTIYTKLFFIFAELSKVVVFSTFGTEKYYISLR